MSQTSKFWRKPSPTETPHPANSQPCPQQQLPGKRLRLQGQTFHCAVFLPVLFVPYFQRQKVSENITALLLSPKSPEDAYFQGKVRAGCLQRKGARVPSSTPASYPSPGLPRTCPATDSAGVGPTESGVPSASILLNVKKASESNIPQAQICALHLPWEGAAGLPWRQGSCFRIQMPQYWSFAYVISFPTMTAQGCTSSPRPHAVRVGNGIT